MLPMYNTRTFSQIFEEEQEFLDEWHDSGIYQASLKGDTPVISDDSVRLTFYLLYSKYGNNPIANLDENQFVYKLCATIFQYGPSWEKRLEIQDKLRGLSEAEILNGTKTVYNHAFNPSTTPTTDTLEELPSINDQNTSKIKKGYVEAYTQLWEMIATDVTNDYLNKFQKLFQQFVKPDINHIYVTEVDENE